MHTTSSASWRIETGIIDDIPEATSFLRDQRLIAVEALAMNRIHALRWIRETCTEQYMTTMLAQQPGALFVAREDESNSIIGMSCVSQDPAEPSPELSCLYVAAPYSRQGIGRLLLQKQTDFIRNQTDATRAFMWVMPHNKPMINLATSDGFTQTKRAYGANTSGWTFIELEKDFSA